MQDHLQIRAYALGLLVMVCFAPIVVSALSSAPSSAATSAAKAVEPAKVSGGQTKSRHFVATGAPFNLEGSGLTLAPPRGWLVETSSHGMSLIANERNVSKVKVGKSTVKFRRSFSVLVLNKSEPIDKTRAEGFKSELKAILGGGDRVDVLSAHTFDYQGKDDGIVAYSSSGTNGVPVTQLHVLIGGADQQYLMTYADLSSRYRADSEMGKLAWTVMTQAQVTGVAPWRHRILVGIGIVVVVGFSLVAVVRLLRKRREAARFFGDLAGTITSQLTTSISSVKSSISGRKTRAFASRKGTLSGKTGQNFAGVKNTGLEFSRNEITAKLPAARSSQFSKLDEYSRVTAV